MFMIDMPLWLSVASTVVYGVTGVTECGQKVASTSDLCR